MVTPANNLKSRKAQRRILKWELINGRGRRQSDPVREHHGGRIGKNPATTTKGSIIRRRLASRRIQSETGAGQGQTLDPPQVVPEALRDAKDGFFSPSGSRQRYEDNPLATQSGVGKRKRGEEDWCISKRYRISRGLRRRTLTPEDEGGKPGLEAGFGALGPPLCNAPSSFNVNDSTSSLANLSTASISFPMIFDVAKHADPNHVSSAEASESVLVPVGPNSDSDLCDLEDGKLLSSDRTTGTQSSVGRESNTNESVGDSADPSDHFINTGNGEHPVDDELCDLSDGVSDVFNITLPVKLPFSSSNQEQYTRRSPPLFLSSTLHQPGGGTSCEDCPAPVYSYPRVVSGDVRTETPVKLHNKLSETTTPVRTDGLNNLGGEYRESENPVLRQMKVAGYQSTSEMSAQPPLSSYEYGDGVPGCSEENDAIRLPFHTHTKEAPVLVPSRIPLADTGLEAISGQCLVQHDVLCDLDDESSDHINGRLGLSPARQQRLVDDLSPTPMSIGSLPSYYGNNSHFGEGVGNSNTNGSPSCVDLQHKESETDDPMESYAASVDTAAAEPQGHGGFSDHDDRDWQQDAILTDRILVTDYRSTSVTSTKSVSSDDESGDLPAGGSVTNVAVSEIYRDGDEWGALPQSKPGPGSRAESPELLDLDGDEMDFEVASIPSSQLEHEPPLALVADYRSISAMSTKSDSSYGESEDLPAGEFMASTAVPEVYKDGDEWGALPQSKPGPGNRAESPELLDLDGDHEMDFEVASIPSSQLEREPSLALVADYQSISAMSTKSVSFNGESGDLPAEEFVISTGASVYGDGDGWDALPQFISRAGSLTESSDLLGLDEDHEMDLEVASAPSPRCQSPVWGTQPAVSGSGSGGRAQRRKRNRTQSKVKRVPRLEDDDDSEDPGGVDMRPREPQSHSRANAQETNTRFGEDARVTRALQNLEGILQKVVENSDAQLREMGSMLRSFAESPPRPFRGSERGDEGGLSTSRRKGVHAVSLELKRHVREHALVMLGRKDKTAQVPPPPSCDQIKTFLETGKKGPKGKAGKLRLDLEGPIRSSWNKKAAQRFRRDFQKSGLYGPWPKADVEEAFLRHSETIRSHYQHQTGDLTERDLLLRRTRSARRNRLQKLAQNRKRVCRTNNGLQKFERYVRRLGDDGGMSGDESDRNAKQTDKKYFVLRPAWRSQEVTGWLHIMDLVYVSSRFGADGRPTKGNWIRDRVRSTRVDQDSKPIPGLPHNFYDQSWLGSLTSGERKALRMREAIDLSHSEEIIRLASRHKFVRNRSDKPQ